MHMIKNFTELDLLKFIYGDTLEDETRHRIQTKILTDRICTESYYSMSETKELLDELVIEPSSTKVAEIMGFARVYKGNADLTETAKLQPDILYPNDKEAAL